jgi:hypothetical protein
VNRCPRCGLEPLPAARFCVAPRGLLSGAVRSDQLRDPRRPAWIAAGLLSILLAVEFAGVVLRASRSLEARRDAQGDVMAG